jgi:hypothetical protein
MYLELMCLLALIKTPATPSLVPAQATAETTAAQSASPELVGKISDELKITPKQAEGGVGALLGLAKQRLKPEEFTEVANAIPGTDGLLKVASGLGSAGGGAVASTGAMADLAKGNSAAGLASVAGSFRQLGLTPDVATKMVPVLTTFVQSKGAAGAAKLLTGALK